MGGGCGRGRAADVVRYITPLVVRRYSGADDPAF